MSSLLQAGRKTRLSLKSVMNDPLQSSPNDAAAVVTFSVEERPILDKLEIDDKPSEPVQDSGEYRLLRAINEVLCFNSRKCSTGCLYSMDEIIPTGYLLLMEEQNNSWFSMQLSATSQPVQLWFADFSARLQESLDEEARGRLFTSRSLHVFAGAKRQTAGAPLHCRRFAYLPAEMLNHPSLMLHHLPVSPDQLLIVDHMYHAAAYVTVIVGFAKQPEKLDCTMSSKSVIAIDLPSLK